MKLFLLFTFVFCLVAGYRDCKSAFSFLVINLPFQLTAAEMTGTIVVEEDEDKTLVEEEWQEVLEEDEEENLDV